MIDDTSERRAVMAWRRGERARLIAARIALPVAEHRASSLKIEMRLEALFDTLPAKRIGFYWPFRREFDPVPLMRKLIAAGRDAALPVVIKKNAPLEFRTWHPGTKMDLGVYDIPYPAAGAAVAPDALLVAMVGFDRQGYRLGYGGGYYDRSLAALAPRPLAIGICFALGELASIQPLPHDIPMDHVVTESMAARRGPTRLTDT
jgi:5,10-methenyltetrahydrofolate synthetase